MGSSGGADRGLAGLETSWDDFRHDPMRAIINELRPQTLIDRELKHKREIDGELFGGNKAREAGYKVADDLRTEQANAERDKRIKEKQDELKDIQASTGAQGIRATAQAKSNASFASQKLGAGSDERDYLGL